MSKLDTTAGTLKSNDIGRKIRLTIGQTLIEGDLNEFTMWDNSVTLTINGATVIVPRTQLIHFVETACTCQHTQCTTGYIRVDTNRHRWVKHTQAGRLNPEVDADWLQRATQHREHRVQLADYRTPHGHITAYYVGCEWTTTAHMTEATAQAAQHLTTNR